jgi:hypothetical protein
MKDNSLKKIITNISKECWKKIKIMSIEKELSFADTVKELLEEKTQSKEIKK